MDAKQSFPGGYEQTLPVLTRPPASDSSTWAETDPNFDTDPYTMSMLSLPPTTPAPPPQTAAPASAPNATSQQPAQAQATATTTSTDRNAPTKIRKPRKAANASAGKSTLFWVHSDPDSAAGGTKEETLKRIRSHVMSEHNRKKRLENTKKYKGKSWKHLAFQPPETIPGGMGPPRPPVSTPSSSSSSSRLGSQVSESPPLKNELVPTTSAVEYYPPVPAETATWTEQTWSEDSWEDSNYDGVDGVVGFSTTSQRYSPWSYVGSGVHDPFNTGHTQLTDRMMRHLQNCWFSLDIPSMDLWSID
jgi:hypothetical protein